jgi:serine/threonine-protein kinase RIO1
MLIDNIESPKPLPVQKVVLDAEFIPRESTRALRPAQDMLILR